MLDELLKKVNVIQTIHTSNSSKIADQNTKIEKIEKKHIIMIISQENGKIFTAKLKHTQLANKDIPNFVKAHILMKK